MEEQHPTTRSGRRGSVRFAETSEMVIIERSTAEENATKWYSLEDKEYFKLLLKRDIRIMQRKLESTPMGMFDEEDMFNCIGMEVRLNSHL